LLVINSTCTVPADLEDQEQPLGPEILVDVTGVAGPQLLSVPEERQGMKQSPATLGSCPVFLCLTNFKAKKLVILLPCLNVLFLM
jgi:hypothetical protein